MTDGEERHTFELIGLLDDEQVVHLRCPTCGKEVAYTRPTIDADTRSGYRVLRDEHGTLLQGDFFARHSWSTNVDLTEPEVDVRP